MMQCNLPFLHALCIFFMLGACLTIICNLTSRPTNDTPPSPEEDRANVTFLIEPEAELAFLVMKPTGNVRSSDDNGGLNLNLSLSGPSMDTPGNKTGVNISHNSPPEDRNGLNLALKELLARSSEKRKGVNGPLREILVTPFEKRNGSSVAISEPSQDKNGPTVLMRTTSNTSVVPLSKKSLGRNFSWSDLVMKMPEMKSRLNLPSRLPDIMKGFGLSNDRIARLVDNNNGHNVSSNDSLKKRNNSLGEDLEISHLFDNLNQPSMDDELSELLSTAFKFSRDPAMQLIEKISSQDDIDGQGFGMPFMFQMFPDEQERKERHRPGNSRPQGMRNPPVHDLTFVFEAPQQVEQKLSDDNELGRLVNDTESLQMGFFDDGLLDFMMSFLDEPKQIRTIPEDEMDRFRQRVL